MPIFALFSSHTAVVFIMKSYLAILILLLPAFIAAQSPSQSRPCQDPRYRQFDFWIGEWDVFSGDRLVGRNRIERILDGCVLMENWVGQGGSKGHSFNLFNAASGKWEQTWVDNSGTVINFKGSFDPNKQAMAFTANAADTSKHKMTFWRMPDGSIKQKWEAAAKGQEYRVLFEGTYRRREEI